MENWSVREDDRPYLRPGRGARVWPAALIAALLAGGLLGYYAYTLLQQQEQRAPATEPAAPAAAAPEPQAGSGPLIGPPRSVPQAQTSLPALDQSDALARESIVSLIGRKAFEERVVPDQLIRRIVVTVDNLPRPTASRRTMPLDAVPGAFRVAGSGEASVIDAANFARYAPFVRVMDSIDARALVYSYARAYPLFQRAYEELGYPGKHFNDRLVEALDDMLAAPELGAPAALVQPRVLYEFADPDLEARSAGQKILLRMGGENALRVKAKLRELRREILAATARPGP